MSAARAAQHVSSPSSVVKSGRMAQGAKAHRPTRALAGSDAVYEPRSVAPGTTKKKKICGCLSSLRVCSTGARRWGVSNASRKTAGDPTNGGGIVSSRRIGCRTGRIPAAISPLARESSMRSLPQLVWIHPFRYRLRRRPPRYAAALKCCWPTPSTMRSSV